MTILPKRLIEVDLPIRRISAHARREKSIRHGHISTLHIWWARRPLAACRAVLCASLWPDPADPNCPEVFIFKATEEMLHWTTHERQKKLSAESRERFNAARKDATHFDDLVELRMALLDFIADFANWDNSTDLDYLATSSRLTQIAHEEFGGMPGSRPLVVDPFAGGGAIPLEAARVGGIGYASDLNPIPYLLNKATLEYIPRYKASLIDDIRKWGDWTKQAVFDKLEKYYQSDKEPAPIAYLWARTVVCEGPGCGAIVPMIKGRVLSRKKGNTASVYLDYSRGKTPIISLKPQISKEVGTNKRSNATCPCCGYTTARERIVEQAKNGDVGEMLLAVVCRDESGRRIYRMANKVDLDSFNSAKMQMQAYEEENPKRYLLDEELPYLRSIFNVHVYSINTWGKLFNPRQKLALFAFADVVHDQLPNELEACRITGEYKNALITFIAFCVDRIADYMSNICRWDLDQQRTINTFCRQALGMVWDYAENVPYAKTVGSWDSMLDSILKVVQNHPDIENSQIGSSVQGSATDHFLPDASAAAFFTDPPYYDAIPYANLSDFFIVWLKRMLGDGDFAVFEDGLSPKSNEAVQLAERNQKYKHKTREFFHEKMRLAFERCRGVLASNGVGIIVFAHKETESWEALLDALVKSGNRVTASWPIDTEQAQRLRAQSSAALASSVHLVVRPRITKGDDAIGDWRDVLEELPKRIHAWLPHLAEEGVVGADAIFACLGPALEIFSRYDSVEKASGEVVPLREYLEQVWAAVSREALSSVVADADLSGFESDARLSAMWLWTVAASPNGGDEEDEELDTTKIKPVGFALEYDAARKIAQGLGANLDDMKSIVEVKGDKALLLPVAQRTEYLFGKGESAPESAKGRKKKNANQMDMFAELIEDGASDEVWEEKTVSKPGETILDRVHQAMILFASGRGEALKRFLVDDGVGQDPGLWKLAQAFSALYPPGTQEKRWVDGVLARKKGLGL
jgi:adenine-specific DNA methylase